MSDRETDGKIRAREKGHTSPLRKAQEADTELFLVCVCADWTEFTGFVSNKYCS